MSTLSREELGRLIISEGFDVWGITGVQKAPHRNAFLSWLEAGKHAEMQWLARQPEQRTDPRQLLEGASSVIVLAINYLGHESKPAPNGLTSGRIARYARGRDYHNSLRKRLRRISRRLDEAGGRQRLFIDSGPLLERDLAVLAGIGWHGKNTMVLNRRQGTWLLLAEILTTLPFPSDTPQRERCGTCTRCLDACPTQAFDAPYQLDARKCIAYWTIEHRGSIPEQYRSLIGDRIFGCDECLQVCPWNRFAVASHDPDFATRPASCLPLQQYLEMDEQQFLDTFAGSPIRRARWQGFLRNVCIALGNVGTISDIPSLEATLSLPDPVVREHAAWAIERIHTRLSGTS